MRLDKFLKVSRLIRRRPLAKQLAEQGRVTINGNQAKAGTNVEKGDELIIRFGQKHVTVRVKEVKEVVRKNEADMLYEVIKEESIKE